MRTLISNGTIVTADGSSAADVLIDGETIAQIGADLAGAGVSADETIDATGSYVIPGGIDVHTHMELPFGGTFAKDTFETGTRAAAFGGTTSIVDFAVQSRGASLRDGPRRVARQGRGQRRHRLRLPHDHERRQRRHARRDGRPGRRGRARLQAVHRLPGRLLQRRRRDLPGDAADREERRADHDARRERDGHRRRGRADRRGRHDRPDRPRARAQGDLRGRGDQPGDPPGARRPASPCTSSTCRRARRWPRSAPRAIAGSMAFAETCPQYLFLSLDDMGNGFEGAKFVCSPPLRTEGPLGRPVERASSRTTCRWSRPTTARSTSTARRSSGRGDFRKVPNGLPGRRGSGRPAPRRRRRRRPDHAASAGSRSSRRRRPSCSGCTRRKGAIAVGSDADLVVYDPDRQAHDLRGDPPHGRRLLVLRGPDGPGRHRDVVLSRGIGRRAGRRVHRAQGPRQVHQAGAGRLRPPELSDGGGTDEHHRCPVRARERHRRTTGGDSRRSTPTSSAASSSRRSATSGAPTWTPRPVCAMPI